MRSVFILLVAVFLCITFGIQLVKAPDPSDLPVGEYCGADNWCASLNCVNDICFIEGADAGPELLTNGDFETGDLNGWTDTSGLWSVGDDSGDHYAYPHWTGPPSIYQNLYPNLTSGKQYAIVITYRLNINEMYVYLGSNTYTFPNTNNIKETRGIIISNTFSDPTLYLGSDYAPDYYDVSLYEVIESDCVNGIDDDSDGFPDGIDPDCGGDPVCWASTPKCDGSCPVPCTEDNCTSDPDCCLSQVCDDGCLNGDETDVMPTKDCGGTTCDKCSDGFSCLVSSDCENDYCNPDNICSVPNCTDGWRNGDEDGVDCGGSSCVPQNSESGFGCIDGTDNDNDCLVDCADTVDCSSSGFCDDQCGDSYCSNGENGTCCDPEGDGQEAPFRTLCEDLTDNDNQNGADCADISCDGKTVGNFPNEYQCNSSGETACNDIYDYDGDGFINCHDPSCDGRVCGATDNFKCYGSISSCVDTLTYEPYCGEPPVSCQNGEICDNGQCRSILSGMSGVSGSVSGAPGFELNMISFMFFCLFSLFLVRKK